MPGKYIAWLLVLCLAIMADNLCWAEKHWPDQPLRGVNSKLLPGRGNQQSTEEHLKQIFRTCSAWKVNIIRFQLEKDGGTAWSGGKGAIIPPIPADNPMEPYEKHLSALRIALDLAEKYRIYLLPTAGDIVGRNIDVMYNKSDGTGYGQTLVQLWEHVARQYGSHPWLLGYDLLNEPHTENDLKNWQSRTLPELVKAIRQHDTDTYLVVEPGPWGKPDGFKSFQPLDDPKVVYSFHFYAPHNYTHQGVKSWRAHTRGKLVYPGNLQMFDTTPELYWDREQLKNHAAPAREFQEKHGVRMFVGEFSVIRWAPGAARWLQDAISVFEEYGWDWCYHSYGGWNGWNPTFAPNDPADNQTDGGKQTDRLKVLRQALKHNNSITAD